ncbi:MAG TPA: hypothetical protein PLR41_19025 [Alphaproteobacteria bacterium]|nr:hypothetical protein [Alphaproteobacteria bacterium]
MAGTNRLDHERKVGSAQRDVDGVVAAQRWAYAIAAAFVTVALVHALW